jgi:hypothetical protein
MDKINVVRVQMLPEMKCLEIRVEPVISYQSGARIAFGHLLLLIALCQVCTMPYPTHR